MLRDALEPVKFFLETDISVIKNDLSGDFRQKFEALEALINANCNWTYREDLIHELLDNEIVKFIKIVMLFEKKASRGSASAIPNLLSHLESRKSESYRDMFIWVAKENNSKNDWLPTGRMRHAGCMTPEECNAVNHRIHTNKLSAEEDQQKAHDDAVIRRRAKAQVDIWNALRRRDIKAINALVTKGINLDETNSEGITIRSKLIDLGMNFDNS